MKQIFQFIVKYLKNTDLILWCGCICASACSVLALYGIYRAGYGSIRQVIVQALASGLGMGIAWLISRMDYETLGRMWKLYTPVVYFLVLLTFFIGTSREGADDKAWLPLPFGMTLQPSELLKIVFIFTFCLHLSKVDERINSLPDLALLCLHGGIPILLIHFQGDDGSALVFAFIFLVLMFVAGLSWKYILIAVGALGVAAPLAWFFLFTYDQKERILCIINPARDILGIGWQQYCGRISLGSGQVFGTGLLHGQHQYVPEIYNDFIFSFIGESFGFLGCLLLIALLALIAGRILMTAKLATDKYGRYLCIGVFTMFSVQVLINLGMCLSFLPVIGITLPFLSAGGTSVLTTYVGVGIALSVYMNSKRNLFLDK